MFIVVIATLDSSFSIGRAEPVTTRPSRFSGSICRVKSAVTVRPAATVTVCVADRKPRLVTRMVCDPVGTLRSVYTPEASVSAPSPVPSTITVAPTTAVPSASTTRPVTVPVCAKALENGTSRAAATRHALAN